MPRTRESNGPPVRVGCSGWVYRHWKDDFYAGTPQRLWFAHYARHFDTVEINATFYRTPSPAMWEAWRAKAPPGFCYAVKANRFITHLKKLAGVEEATAQFLGVARALGEHLGPILYQLPPKLKRNPERLEAFLALLPTDLEHVVEFRSADCTTRKSSACSTATVPVSSPTTSSDWPARGGRPGGPPMSASTARAANIMAATAPRRSPTGRNGWWSSGGPGGAPGPISTMTSAATRSLTPQPYALR